MVNFHFFRILVKIFYNLWTIYQFNYGISKLTIYDFLKSKMTLSNNLHEN